MGKDKMRTGQQTRDKRLVPPDPKQQALPELRGLPRVPVRLRRTPKRPGVRGRSPIRAWEVTQDVRAYVRACALAHGSGGGAERPEPETELGSGPGRGRCERRRADPGGGDGARAGGTGAEPGNGAGGPRAPGWGVEPHFVAAGVPGLRPQCRRHHGLPVGQAHGPRRQNGERAG